jgi:hypothetical protein
MRGRCDQVERTQARVRARAQSVSRGAARVPIEAVQDALQTKKNRLEISVG